MEVRGQLCGVGAFHMGSEDRTLVPKLMWQCLCQLSHLTSLYLNCNITFFIDLFFWVVSLAFNGWIISLALLQWFFKLHCVFNFFVNYFDSFVNFIDSVWESYWISNFYFSLAWDHWYFSVCFPLRLSVSHIFKTYYLLLPQTFLLVHSGYWSA